MIDTFTISDEQSFASMLSHGTRYARPGRYTRLTVDGQLWMTDTDAEMSDHMAFVNHVVAARAGHILITGLGLGMVVHAMLLLPRMQRVDVIETDSDVIALVAGHCRDMVAVSVSSSEFTTVTPILASIISIPQRIGSTLCGMTFGPPSAAATW